MDHAISIKQPWAALVAHGLKTIEIRRWATRRRGRVLIHAARIPDPRPESWKHVPKNLVELTRLQGGIVGEAEVIECRSYGTAAAFVRDRRLHLNDPSWFQAPAMHGFVFANARPLPFRRYPGSLYFFEVDDAPQPAVPTTTGLLVSVRSAAEATTALAGGADLIDIKDPRHGSLGKASDSVIAEIVKVVAGRQPVSAALGELCDLREVRSVSGLAFVKCGLARLGRRKGWERQLRAFRKQIAGLPLAPQVVTVAYADWKTAGAPSWKEVVKFALGQEPGVLLMDTFDKSLRRSSKQEGGHSPKSRPSTLLDWLTVDEVRDLCHKCRDAGVRIALAGSLGLSHLGKLLDCKPTWFALRGAVCEANRRDGEIHILKVRDMAAVLRWHQQAATVEN